MMRIIKLICALVLLALACSVGYGQDTKTPFATTPSPIANRFAWTTNGIWTDSPIKFTRYISGDTSLLGIMPSTGRGVTITKAMLQNWVTGGGGLVNTVTATYPVASSGGANPNITLDTAEWHSTSYYNTIYAPISGSGNYVQNRTSNTQTASFNISGSGYIATAAQTNDSIYFWGNSITTGFGLSSATLRYSTIVAQRLNMTEINNAVSNSHLENRSPACGAGSFLADYLSTIPTKTTGKRLGVIMYGINDIGCGESNANYNPVNFSADYLSILSNFISKGWAYSDIILTTITPKYNWTGNGTTRHPIFNDTIRAIANRLGCGLFDAYSFMDNRGGVLLLQSDGTHVNIEGNKVLAVGLLNKIGYSVETESQKLAVNGLTELNQLKYSNTDSAVADSIIAPIVGLRNGRLGLAPNFYVQNNTSTTAVAGSININGKGIFESDVSCGNFFIIKSASAINFPATGSGVAGFFYSPTNAGHIYANNFATGVGQALNFQYTGGKFIINSNDATYAGATYSQIFQMLNGGGIFRTTSLSGSDFGLLRVLNTNNDADASMSFADGNDADADRWVIGKPNASVFGLTDAFIFYKGGTKAIFSSTGFFGIGVGVPLSLLHVGGNADVAATRQAITVGNSGYAAPSVNNSTSNGDKFVFYNGAAGKFGCGLNTDFTWWFQAIGSSANFKWYIGSAGTAGTQVMNLTGSGLTVNGTATIVNADAGALTTDSLVLRTSAGVLKKAAPLGTALETLETWGNATLSGGTIAVANTAITANSFVVVSYKTASGTQGFLTYTLNAGVGFTINSSSGADASVVTYHVKY